MMNRRSFLKVSGQVALAASALPVVAIGGEVKKQIQRGKPAPSERPFPIFVYQRMGFGPTATELLGTDKFHFEQYVEIQLHPDKIIDTVCEQKLNAANFKTLNLSLKDCWKNYKVAADELKKKEEKLTQAKSNENDLRQTPIRELELATWIRAVYSEKQLQELLVQFWHDHFSVNGWDNTISPTMVAYDRDVIRKNVFGNFQAMVEGVTKSPAMLLYLDNGLNQSANPNENFAREIFELHTLGADNYLGTLDRRKVFGFNLGRSKGYVDGDVYEASRAFTGWREDSNQKDATNTGEFNYYEAWHDRFQKIVLGHAISEYQPPMKDGLDVIGFVSKHEGTARWISKKLCRRLVSDHPSDALVAKITKVFIANQKKPDQLRKVVEAILLSPDFKDPSNAKLKRPFEYSVSLIRALRRDDDHAFSIDEDFVKKQGGNGQRLYQWKTPDGYPDIKERWMTSSGLLSRFQLANQLIDKKLISVDEFKTEKDQAFAMQKRVIGYETRNQSQILTHFLQNHLSADGKPADPQTLKSAVLLTMMGPELQWK
jgi:uncharacterized protein (DUF1800 family)